MKQKIIQQGAEAVIIKDKSNIIKQRIKKSYRIKELDDKIRKLRTRSEAKLLKKASEIISIPNIQKADEKTKEIKMDYLDGEKLSENLDNFEIKKQLKVCRQIGENIAKLHDSEIIHGDLTTSNMICDSASLHTLRPKVFFIDFGLGYRSNKYEDKAVDIHLLKQALEAKHFKNWKKLFQEVIKGYNKSKDSEIVLQRLQKVEKRGRYKH